MTSPPTPTHLTPLHPLPLLTPPLLALYMFNYVLPTPSLTPPTPTPSPPPSPSPHSHYILSSIYYLNMNTSWYNIIMFRVMFNVLHSMADTQKTDKQTNKVIAITLLCKINELYTKTSDINTKMISYCTDLEVLSCWRIVLPTRIGCVSERDCVVYV